MISMAILILGHRVQFLSEKAKQSRFFWLVTQGKLFLNLLNDIISLLLQTAAVAEWLRRWTRNPMGSSRTGSNPVRSGKVLILKSIDENNYLIDQLETSSGS